MSLNVADLMTAKWTACCFSNFEEIRRSVTKVVDYEDFLSRRREKESFDWNDCHSKASRRPGSNRHRRPGTAKVCGARGAQAAKEVPATISTKRVHAPARCISQKLQRATQERRACRTEWLLGSPEGSISSSRLLFEAQQSSSTAVAGPFTSFMRGFLCADVKH